MIFIQKACESSLSKDIRGALRDLVAFVQFKKREKHLKNTLLKLTLLHGCLSHFLNCTNATKSRNASHIQRLSHVNFYVFYQQIYISFLY